MLRYELNGYECDVIDGLGIALKFFGDARGSCGIEVRDRQFGALTRKGPGNLFPNAAICTGDDCDFALKLHASKRLSRQIVMDDLAQPQCQVGHNVLGGDDLQNRQLGNGRERMRHKR